MLKLNKHILLVEDEIRMRILLRDYFIKEGFKVSEASNGQEGFFMFKRFQFDLIILDIMMPLMDGFTLCKNIRDTSKVPIIILTAKSEEDDKLLGYELGADDYVTKPFSPKVLVAKAKALLKRNEYLQTNQEDLLNLHGLEINKLSHEVKVFGNIINLSPKEFDLLIYLVDNKGIALSRDKILDNVWGLDYDGDSRTVDTNIKRLREKLGEKSSFISTVRGSGYKFEVKA